MSLLDKIDRSNVPQHVAVIMDGNGRWAQEKGQERVYGHLNGVESVRATLKAAMASGVKLLTLYAFSTENWNRPKKEVDALMNLLVNTITSEIAELNSNGVKLQAIGNLASLPEECEKELQSAIETTKKNESITLVLALSYSSRWELTNAMREIVAAGYTPGQINEQTIQEHLTTKGLPDPELLIRTSGENRISNFLLWQIAYAELYFTETLWPDFREEDFYAALVNYQSRERRFGLISEQLAEASKNESNNG
jgi:undecaprenyl diphosphate synthase